MESDIETWSTTRYLHVMGLINKWYYNGITEWRLEVGGDIWKVKFLQLKLKGFSKLSKIYVTKITKERIQWVKI